VTLVKDGKKLVTSRVRQSIGARQASSQQWARRMATDRAAKKTVAESKKHAAESGSGERTMLLELAADPSQVKVEMAADPSGIGFAFGGIHPGTLHAHGKLFEAHSVSYSIGLVGQYLLHVRLRQQAVALPGSPFTLLVTPGTAHALSCQLPAGSIGGPVGSGPEAGCGIKFTTYDLMGNKCIQGGATVTGNLIDSRGHDSAQLNKDTNISIKDNADGSYSLHWRSDVSGTYSVAIKVFGEHVGGSPTTFKLDSVTPQLSKTELSGAGLKSAVAGQPSRVKMCFFDTYDNAARPDNRFRFGLALLINEKGRNFKDIETQDYKMECLDADACVYELSYKPQKDGSFDLHLWADDLHSTTKSQQYERFPLTGSPFHVVVTPGEASPQMSNVEGWVKESRAVDKHGKVLDIKPDEVIAGDSVILRPAVCDALGNNTALEEGALDIVVVFPDGSRQSWLDEKALEKVALDDRERAALKFTIASKGGLTTYDIRHEATHAGYHEVIIKLNGTQIKGSPVGFDVQTAVPEVKNAKTFPPSSAPLYSDRTYTILLKTFDRFNNPIRHGGLAVSARMQLIKNNVHDLTTLIPSNHSVEVVDNEDGTYNVQVSLVKIAATVKVIVNMDKNIPASGGELPPLQMTFVPNPELAGAETVAVVEAPPEDEMEAAEEEPPPPKSGTGRILNKSTASPPRARVTLSPDGSMGSEPLRADGSMGSRAGSSGGKRSTRLNSQEVPALDLA